MNHTSLSLMKIKEFKDSRHHHHHHRVCHNSLKEKMLVTGKKMNVHTLYGYKKVSYLLLYCVHLLSLQFLKLKNQKFDS